MVKLHSWKLLNFKKLAIIFCVMFFSGILLGYMIFPKLLKTMIGGAVGLKPGSKIRELYTKAPFAIDFKIYLFNITNREEVASGGKPKLQEIGPYMFEEWKEKFDMEDDDKEDTITYRMKNTFIFRPDLSNGLTGNEFITTVHPLIMGMGQSVNIDKKPMLGMTNDAINAIFHNPIDPFWSGKVMDFLFNGFDVDCSSTEFAAQAVCSVLGSGDISAIEIITPEHLKFSMMAGANATSVGIYKVSRGVKSFRTVGKMLAYNDEEEMDVWEDDEYECNQYRGTDSTIFPPMLNKDDGLWAWEASLCLSIGAIYVGPSKYAGMPTWEYTLKFGDPTNEEHLKCYCVPDEQCPRAGTINLFACVGSPIVISLPHFYDADPAILQQFASGLYPKKDEHSVYIHFESITGSPLSAAKKLQFSIDSVPIPEIDCMKNIQPTLYPLFWVEESVSLNKTWTNQLKNQLFLLLKIMAAIKWICIIIGAIGCIMASVLQYQKSNNTIETTKPIDPISKHSGVSSISSIQTK